MGEEHHSRVSQRLTEEQLETYSRQIVLRDIGYEGQLKLRRAKACIVGLGGLGCPSAVQLTAMGVGGLRLVDRDVVERSNLQRQHLYDVESIGYPKVEVAAERLKKLNPDVDMEPLPLSLNADNVEEILEGVDVVVDGLDRMGPRYAINRACVKLKIPYIFGAAIESSGNVSTIIPYQTPCLECFLPELDDESLPTCAVVGVHPAVIGIVSSLEVAEAVKVIIGNTPQLANKLLYCDLRNMSFEKISVSRAEECPVCGIDPTKQPAPLKWTFVEEVCGRGGKRTFVVNPQQNLALNLNALYRVLRKNGFAVKVKARLGLTFEYSKNVKVSLLKSGVMIVERAENQDHVVKIYRELVGEGGFKGVEE